MNNEIQVTEKMAALIQWANDKGEEEIRKLLRERLLMLKEECAANGGRPDSDGYKWNDLLEPNDNNNQWNSGGDCNLCRRRDYCGRQCRANKLLKNISTHFLYECYLQDHPQELMHEAANGITPDQMLEQLGVKGLTAGDSNAQLVS